MAAVTPRHASAFTGISLVLVPLRCSTSSGTCEDPQELNQHPQGHPAPRQVSPVVGKMGLGPHSCEPWEGQGLAGCSQGMLSTGMLSAHLSTAGWRGTSHHCQMRPFPSRHG